MKSLSTLALITAFTSTSAFAAGSACDQPSFPGFGPGFNPMQPAVANYEPAYIKAMRDDMVKRGADMRAELEKSLADTRAEVEAYNLDDRAHIGRAFPRPDLASMTSDPMKFMQEQRAAAEKTMAEMRRSAGMPQFQGPQFAAPQFQAPQFQAPVAAVDPAEAQKAWQEQQTAAMKQFEEQRKAYAEQAQAAAQQWQAQQQTLAEQQKAAAEQWQAQMKTQQEAMAAQQAAAAKRWEEARSQYAQPQFAPYQVSAPGFAPMDQGAMMKRMDEQRAAAEKMMHEMQERMQERVQCRTI
jgi:hypothetical protein